MTIWDDIIAQRGKPDPRAKRVIDNAAVRTHQAATRGRPLKHPEKESKQAKRRREYLEDVQRSEKPSASA